MSLVCPQCYLTFYPGAYPSETGGVSLLGEGDWVEEGSALNGEISQLVQRQEGHRWATPAFWPRGNRALALEWTRVIADVALDGTAIALAMEAAEALPSDVGWVRLELPNVNRAWAILPAVVRAIGWTHVPRKNELHLRYTIEKGLANEIAITAEDGAITSEIGTEILTEDGGYYLALEELT